MINMTQPSLYSRGNKLWIRFSFNGKAVRKSLNIFNSKENIKLAQLQIIPQMILKIHSGEFFKNDNRIPTVDEYSKISFENHKHERKVTTRQCYTYIYNLHIKPHFGHKKLNEVKVSDINIWKNSLYAELGLSSRRVNDIKKVFGTILEDAFKDEVISSNPVSKSKSLPVHHEKEVKPFSIVEIQKLIDTAKGQDKNLIATLFMTGMRTGELIGLKWSDIDLKKKEIKINRTIGRGIEGTPKTISSYRIIPIFKSLYPFLENQFELTGEKKSYVFLNSEGNHFFDSKNIRAGLWKKVLDEANVEYRTIYHTRHTFCSINLQNGEDIIWISKIMGHKNPRITLEKYSKYIPSLNTKETVFDKLI